jgi:hypothetical protein
MGGKSSTSTQSTQIPASVLAQYQSVNSRADTTANTPFQLYNQTATPVSGTGYTSANAGNFVAGIGAEQTAGIDATNQYAQAAQPYYSAAASGLTSAQSATQPVNNAALGLAGASAEQVNAQPLTGQSINQYLSPYLGDVLGTTNALANQNNAVAQSGALGTAISSGAFGGDRTGIAAANLNQQNQLAEQSTDANILNTGYQTALSTAQQQQGVNLSAQQANRAALASAGNELASIGSTAYGEGANTASELGSLGSGAQQAGLAGAQAQIGAGTLQQQTQQAQDTAQYNQYLQQQSYPFQVDQFLANIAEGTGALSGSTTTTTQPGGFFSDRRLKHDIKKIGKLFDGQEIYSYKMHGDPRTHIGLIAQKVEKKHPEAVGLAAGYKTVDYGKATEPAANRGHFRSGGNVVPIRPGLASGGVSDLSDILAAHAAMYGQSPSGQYGLAAGNVPRGGSSRVPAPVASESHMMQAPGQLPARPTGMQNVVSAEKLATDTSNTYKNLGAPAVKAAQNAWQTHEANSMLPSTDAQMTNDPDINSFTPQILATDDSAPQPQQQARGGVAGFALGGVPYSPGATDTGIPWQRAGRAGSGTALGGSGVTPGTGSMGGLVGLANGTGAGANVMPQGLAAGGTPYSADPDLTELNIPDENAHNQMIKAPDLPKQAPTGFQQLMSMGSGLGGMSSMMPSGGLGGGGGGSGGADTGESLGDDGSDAFEFADSNRGGRIRKRRDSGGGLDADDVTSQSADRQATATNDAPDTSIQGAAPPLAHAAPNTSLDSVKHLAIAAAEAYGGDYGGAADQVYQAYGSTQTNNRRGGRIHKDDGGDVDGQTVLPEIEVDGTRPDDPVQQAPPAGLAAANDDIAPVSIDPSDMKLAMPRKSALGAVGDFWENHKTEIIPALEGLAAMGTAPTRHLGVALAAGLGAGAQSYFPTQQAAANVQATNLQNERMGYQLQALKSPPPSGGAGSVGAPPQPGFSGVGADPSNIAAEAQRRYAFKDIWTPQEQANLQRQQQLQQAGLPNTLPTIMQLHNSRMQNQQTAQQQGALSTYNAAYQAATAPPGAALAKVMNIDPTAAKEIQERSGGDADAADGMARVWASEVGNQTYQQTGRKPVTGTDGIARDPFSQRPILGQTPVGMSAEQHAAYLERLATPVDIGANARPALGSTAAGRQLPQNPQPTVELPGNAPAPASAPLAPKGPRAQPGAPSVPKGSNLDFSDAPNKPSFIGNPNVVLSDDQKDTSKKYAEKEASLKAEAGSLQQTQAEVVQAKRMLALLPNAKTGPGTETMSAIQTALGNMTGSQFTSWLDSNPAAYALLQKQLGNSALQQRLSEMRGEGAQVRLGAQQDNLILNKLSASPEMPKAAIAGLLNQQIQQAKYDMARESSIPAYLAQGKDAMLFDSYYSTRHPLGGALSTEAPAGTAIKRPGQQTSGPQEGTTSQSKSGKPIIFRGGQWVYQ